MQRLPFGPRVIYKLERSAKNVFQSDPSTGRIAASRTSEEASA